MCRTGKAIGTLAAAMSLAMFGSGLALADTVYNTLDNSIDNPFEILNLTAGGTTGQVTLKVRADQDTGEATAACNVSTSSPLKVAVTSGTSTVATVTATVTFTACNQDKTVIVTPVAQGTSNVTFAKASDNVNTGNFDFTAARFKAEVAAAADPCATVANPAAPVFTAPTAPTSGWFTTVPSAAATSTTTGATISYAVSPSTTFGAEPTLGQGTTTVIAKATDANCATKTTTTSREFKVDTIAPDVDPANVTNTTWRNSSLSQDFTASDGGSGLAADSPATFTLTASDDSANASTPTLAWRTVYDVAGNSTTRTVSAKIDTVDPEVSADQSNTTWSKADVESLSFTASDALSGIAEADKSFKLNATAESIKTDAGVVVPTKVEKTITDAAGNSNKATFTAKIDKTTPTVTCPSSPVYVLNDRHASLSATVADTLSGPTSTTASATPDVSKLGGGTVDVTGADVAGNEKTSTCSYTVRAIFTATNAAADGSGFAKAKAGSAVPLKWRLTDANGAGVTGLTATNLAAASTGVTCTSTDTEIAEAVAAGSSSLQDLGDGHYQYNWKTASTWGGTCRKLNLAIAGTTISNNFTFTK